METRDNYFILFYFLISHFKFKNNSVVQFFYIYIFYNFLKQIKNPDYFNFIFYFLFYVLLLLSTINREGKVTSPRDLAPCKLRIKITKRSTGRFALHSSIIALFAPKHPSQITIILYKKGIHKWDSHSPPPPLHLIKSSSHILPVGPSKNFFSFSFSFLIFFLV